MINLENKQTNKQNQTLISLWVSIWKSLNQPKQGTELRGRTNVREVIHIYSRASQSTKGLLTSWEEADSGQITEVQLILFFFFHGAPSFNLFTPSSQNLQFLQSCGTRGLVRFITGACASVRRRAPTFYQACLPSNSPPHWHTYTHSLWHTRAVFLRRPDTITARWRSRRVGRRTHDCWG